MMQADLNDITSIPAALVGIHTVIDCATARPEESTQKVDWDGKVALIQSAQVMLVYRLYCYMGGAAARLINKLSLQTYNNALGYILQESNALGKLRQAFGTQPTFADMGMPDTA